MNLLRSFTLGEGFTRRLLYVVAATSCIAFLVIFALRLKLLSSVNSDIGGVEQNVIFGIQLMLNGKSLYPDPAGLPFYINQYTPVYYYLCYLTALLFGLGPGDIHALYFVGRTWTICFNLLTVWAMYRIAVRFMKLPTLLSISLALGSFIFVYRQGFCARADSMMDATILWSMYFFMDYVSGHKRANAMLLISLILASLAIYIKQSGLQIPVIILGFLFFNAPLKVFLKATAITTLLCITPLAALIAFYGDDFIKSVIGGVDNGISWLWVRNFLWGSGLKTKVIIPAIVCGYIVIVRLIIFKGNPSQRFLAFCVTGTFLFNAAISLKAGSNIQYFLVFTNIAFLFIVWYFFGRYYIQGGRKLVGVYHNVAGLLSLACWLLLVLINTNHQYLWIKQIEFDQKDIIVRKEETAARVAAFARANTPKGRYVFANLSNERVDLSYNGRRGINNLLYDCVAVPSLDVLDVSVVKSSVFGYSDFDKRLRDGSISLIIEGSPANDSHIPGLDLARKRFYSPLKRIDGYTIYRHNSLAVN